LFDKADKKGRLEPAILAPKVTGWGLGLQRLKPQFKNYGLWHG
jgi:hypothetical protein